MGNSGILDRGLSVNNSFYRKSLNDEEISTIRFIAEKKSAAKDPRTSRFLEGFLKREATLNTEPAG
jgi:hypothetical protein